MGSATYQGKFSNVKFLSIIFFGNNLKLKCIAVHVLNALLAAEETDHFNDLGFGLFVFSFVLFVCLFVCLFVNKVANSRCAPMYGICRLLSIDR